MRGVRTIWYFNLHRSDLGDFTGYGVFIMVKTCGGLGVLIWMVVCKLILDSHPHEQGFRISVWMQTWGSLWDSSLHGKNMWVLPGQAFGAGFGIFIWIGVWGLISDSHPGVSYLRIFIQIGFIWGFSAGLGVYLEFSSGDGINLGSPFVYTPHTH